ncbi:MULTISPECIES: DUF1360 domain-containing protein [Bacillus]|uniref:DUF1360 domain-containing protein n=1 Tax=Bacillus TaxID=1386 RepID=UPI000BB965F1|nr:MULTISPECIES: DUF1360 domain-containing protein [Bacillus]
MDFNTFWFILLVLAVFRLTRLIVYDKINNFIRRPFHDVVEEVNEDGEAEEYIVIKGKGVQSFIGELLSCHWCVGVWIAILLFIAFTYFPFIGKPILIVFGAAGVAGLIESLNLKLMD